MMASDDKLPDLPFKSTFQAPELKTEPMLEDCQSGPSRYLLHVNCSNFCKY